VARTIPPETRTAIPKNALRTGQGEGRGKEDKERGRRKRGRERTKRQEERWGGTVIYFSFPIPLVFFNNTYHIF